MRRYILTGTPGAGKTAMLRLLEANGKAWTSFRAHPPWSQRQVTYWIVSAKSEETRLRRLQKLIDDLARGRRP